MARGVIFDIQEFTVHDGPGIRKTVFFKGCPLHCMWCHNPEGISFKKELMVSKASCIHCGRCAGRCAGAVCSACGNCVDACPLRLRRICGVEIEAKELAKELLRGREILEESGGGITVTGGEPLAQHKFLLELLRELRPVNTAVETSGYAEADIFKEVLENADLILFDIKHTDSDVHKKATGVDNGRILKNLDYLCGSGKRFYARIPLIPGINDTKENLERIAVLLQGASGLERVELLPYHKSAGVKYAMLGKEYRPAFDVEKAPRIYTNLFEKYGIRSVVL